MTALRALGQEMTEQEAVDMIKEVDKDGQGEVDFDEFIQMMKNANNSDRPGLASAVKDNMRKAPLKRPRRPRVRPPASVLRRGVRLLFAWAKRGQLAKLKQWQRLSTRSRKAAANAGHGSGGLDNETCRLALRLRLSVLEARSAACPLPGGHHHVSGSSTLMHCALTNRQAHVVEWFLRLLM